MVSSLLLISLSNIRNLLIIFRIELRIRWRIRTRTIKMDPHQTRVARRLEHRGPSEDKARRVTQGRNGQRRRKAVESGRSGIVHQYSLFHSLHRTTSSVGGHSNIASTRNAINARRIAGETRAAIFVFRFLIFNPDLLLHELQISDMCSKKPNTAVRHKYVPDNRISINTLEA